MITNCDDDLFAASNRRLGVEFDWVITAEQARGYKPRTENFEFAFERIDVPRERILHVAQSLFHDHVPAKALGMTSVWIDRRQGRPGAGATPPADAQPDLTTPDLKTFADLATMTRVPGRSWVLGLMTRRRRPGDTETSAVALGVNREPRPQAIPALTQPAILRPRRLPAAAPLPGPRRGMTHRLPASGGGCAQT